MGTADTKTAEKSYVSRSGSAAWEKAKPFLDSGTEGLVVSAQLLHDFSIAMLSLNPAPGDLILDLGAGGCWSSDLLDRLNRRSVAVDISLDMLRIGRSRATRAPLLAVVADLEALPFRSGTFDKALCLNAIHHVPHIPQALHEVARVMTADGVALFSEPGIGHATASVSENAMKEFGVLEQEVVVDQFARACREAGFRDVRIKALSYAIPRVDITAEEWVRWSKRVLRKRPLRAVTKMWRAALEFLGVGKRGALLDETIERTLVRTLFGAMQDHPVILASKLPQSTSSRPWAARLRVEMASTTRPGVPMPTTVTMTNVGSELWKRSSSTGVGHVSLGIQLLDAAGCVINRELQRVPLPHDVAPGQSARMAFAFRPPLEPADYNVKFDIVAEGISWFEDGGSETIIRGLRIR